jgi:hypothetical protein
MDREAPLPSRRFAGGGSAIPLDRTALAPRLDASGDLVKPDLINPMAPTADAILIVSVSDAVFPGEDDAP